MKNTIDINKKNLNFNSLLEYIGAIKIFNSIPNVNIKSRDEVYIQYIDLWNESSKYSGFFERYFFDISDVKKRLILEYNKSNYKFFTTYLGEDNKREFNSFDDVWRYYDNLKESYVFYCNNFKDISPKIKSFFENTWFINNNKKFIFDNQWKFLKYKDSITSYLLNRSKIEDDISYKWEMFFIPIEDRKVIENTKKENKEIEDFDLYLISLNILIEFIIAIFSQKNKNISLFVNKINDEIGEIRNKKVRKEIDKKISSLFTNKSQNKCIKSIIWIALMIQNNNQKLVERWAIKNGFKLNNKTIVKWIEEVNEKNYQQLIDEMKLKKEEIIHFLKNKRFNPRNTILFPEFACDFKKTNFKDKSYAIFDKTLLLVFFDEEWKFNKKYLWKAICLYLINNILESRDIVNYNIENILIWNPLHMKWMEINIKNLDSFYKKNYDFDLLNMQLDLRRILNGE